MGIALGLVLLAGVWAWRRRRRAALLAGRDAERPTYTTEPPGRTVRIRSTERL